MLEICWVVRAPTRAVGCTKLRERIEREVVVEMP